MEVTKEIIEQYLHLIAKILCDNSSFVKDNGLMHGKMGIALFLYRCTRVTGEKDYENFAGELLDEISESLSSDISLDFESGLCGIGFGIDYLIKNKYVDQESNDMLLTIDNYIKSNIKLENENDILLASTSKYWRQRGNIKEFDNTISAFSKFLTDKIAVASNTNKLQTTLRLYFASILELLILDFEQYVLDRNIARELFEFLIKENDSLYQTCTRWSGQYILEKLCDYFDRKLPILTPPKAFHLLPPATDIRLVDILALKDNNLLYGHKMPVKAYSKIKQILNDSTLTNEWIKIALPQTMGLSGNMTGFGWVLFDYSIYLGSV